MLQKTSNFQSFKKAPFKGNLILVSLGGDLKASDKLFSTNSFCLNQGWAISSALSATSRAKNQERKKTKAAEQECEKEEDPFGVHRGWGRGPRGQQAS